MNIENQKTKKYNDQDAHEELVDILSIFKDHHKDIDNQQETNSAQKD
jgi:hypothetical protein